MARLRDIEVRTRINDVQDMLGADIPVNDSVELTKYLQDCHVVLYNVLQPERLKNPNTRNRYTHVNAEQLLRLKTGWENYMFDYYDSLQETKVIDSRSIPFHSVFWRNLAVLTACIIRVRYNRNFPYSVARSNDYARSHLLCVSSKSIGEYSMSELLLALKTISTRKWELHWDKKLVDYVVQLEFAIAERISWVTSDDSVYDEGCKRADTGHYIVAMETITFLTKWFYSFSKRIRERLKLQQWVRNGRQRSSPEPPDELTLAVFEKLLRKTADNIHDVSRFFQPMKQLLLLNEMREGELDDYVSAHGNKSAGCKDVLREFRPVNFIAHIEDEQFDVQHVSEILDSSDYTKQRYKELIRLYLINLLFNVTAGCKIAWLRFFVCFERDFGKNYDKIKSSRQPLILQSFSQWYIYYESAAWPANTVGEAFIMWLQLVRDEKDCKLHESIDASPIMDMVFLDRMQQEEEDEDDDELMDCSSWI